MTRFPLLPKNVNRAHPIALRSLAAITSVG